MLTALEADVVLVIVLMVPFPLIFLDLICAPQYKYYDTDHYYFKYAVLIFFECDTAIIRAYFY